MRKVGGSRPRKSTIVDHDFIYKTNDYAAIGIATPVLSSIVRGVTPSIPLLISGDGRANISAFDKEEACNIALEEWFEKRVSGGRPRPWRNTTDKLKAAYYARALAARPERSPYVFTLRIDPRLVDHKKNPTDIMRRRIHDHLSRRLNRSVDLWAAAEIEDELHLHGHMDIDETERDAADAALRAAGGKWRSGRARARQLELKPAGGIDGWANYASLDFTKTQAELTRRREVLQVWSKRAPVVLIVSAPLRAEAEALYETHRAHLAKPKSAVAR
jgi:hypothetical protein